MAVPKKKTSVSRKGMRRAGHTHHIHVKSISTCPNCGAVSKPHCVCPSCGHYKGKEVVKISAAKETETQE